MAGADASRALSTEEALGAVGDRMVASPKLRAQGSAGVPLDLRAPAAGVFFAVVSLALSDPRVSTHKWNGLARHGSRRKNNPSGLFSLRYEIT